MYCLRTRVYGRADTDIATYYFRGTLYGRPCREGGSVSPILIRVKRVLKHPARM